jgi:hypothetical protein
MPSAAAPTADDSQPPSKPQAPPPAEPGCDKEKTPAPCPPVSKLTSKQTLYKVISLVGCIGGDITASAPPEKFTCELMALSQGKKDDIFGKKDWYPAGQAAANGNWTEISTAILNAVKGKPPQTAAWHSPSVGLRAEIPAGDPSCPEGQYVILMFFNESNLQLYFKGCLIGECPIYDNDKWSDILANTGITPQSTPSK